MNKGKRFILCGIVICALVVIAAYAYMRMEKQGSSSADSQTGETSCEQKEEADLSEETGAVDEQENSASRAEDVENDEKGSGSGSTDSSGSAWSPSNNNPSKEAGGSGEATAGRKQLSFPYKDQASKVTVKKVSSYDGYFLEDGSDHEVNNLAVLVLENTGKMEIEYIAVTLSSDSETYHFEGSVLPVGSQIVLQEKDGKAFGDYNWESCKVDYGDIEAWDMVSDLVSCKERADDSIEITNVSGTDIPCLRVFYKHYLEEENAYLGGITYNAKITEVKAGEGMIIRPSHYKSGESKVVFIRSYETDE